MAIMLKIIMATNLLKTIRSALVLPHATTVALRSLKKLVKVTNMEVVKIEFHRNY